MAQEADMELNEIDWISRVFDTQQASNLRQPVGSPQSATRSRQNAEHGSAPATNALWERHELRLGPRFARSSDKSTNDGQREPQERPAPTSILEDRNRDQVVRSTAAEVHGQDSESDMDEDQRFESEPQFIGTVHLLDKENRVVRYARAWMEIDTQLKISL